MAELTLIRRAASEPKHLVDHHRVALKATRATLAKRRWRGTAEDGREFGFDLEAPLTHHVLFYSDGSKLYLTEQLPEEVLEIPIATQEQAARIAWNLGNLHFAVQVLPHAIRVIEDPAVIQFLSCGIAFRRVSCIFLPLSVADHHHHHDHHHVHHG